jgi:hypothetical protein
MKVGIVTFHKSHNYGAMLQAYALSKYVQDKHQVVVEFLNYNPPSLAETYRILPKVSNTSSLVKFLNALRQYKALATKYNNFKLFARSNFSESQPYESLDELMENPPNFDVCITGSDQVFKYKGKGSEVFFLAFCDKNSIPSIAYAPSFGSYSILPSHRDRVKEMLSKINYLSCREPEGAKVISDLTGRDVPTVVDPVFLLKSEEWSTISKAPVGVPTKYILCYALVGYEEQIGLALQLKQSTGLPVVVVGSRMGRKQGDVFINASVEEFIHLFMNASYVITDSFHGTAFSLIFRKPFWSLIKVKAAAARLVNIHSVCGVQGRLLETDHKLNPQQLDLSYVDIDVNLGRFIISSMEYLDAALKDSVKGRV